MSETEPARAEKATDFFTAYFEALELAGIETVILHGYEEYPQRIKSDVDYAVRDGYFVSAVKVLRATCDKHGWLLTQILRHEIFACYCVVVNPRNPLEVVKLDACSNYVRNQTFFLRDEFLVGGRRKHENFYVPSVPAEFVYVLAKASAKGKELSAVVDRLRQLHDQLPLECARAFSVLTGYPEHDCARLLDEPSGRIWTKLGEDLKSRLAYSPELKLREVKRRLLRFLLPTGLVLGVLGSDGAGKSTLLSNLQTMLAPCFRRQTTFHFRPYLWGRRREGIVTEPHAQKPRSKIASWVKVAYYYIDWLAGYILRLRSHKVRSTLILCDRTFDDLLVDPTRYRVQASGILCLLLRRLLPTPDLILVLTGTPEVLHQRKCELPMPEVARQQAALARMAMGDQRMVIVGVDGRAEEVATAACSIVLESLASRCKRRRGWQ